MASKKVTFGILRDKQVLAKTYGMAIPGYNIRLLRREMSLSLEALAEAAGMDAANLSRLENGKKGGGYSDASIKRIADALKVSVDVLFSPPEKLEGAALRMREAPILTQEQLAEWRGPESMEYAKGQVYLFADRARVSRHCFGWKAVDDVNTPTIQPGDELVFDANRQPVLGSFVIAQSDDGRTYIGRFRESTNDKGESTFDVIPLNNLYPAASAEIIPGLELRGTLVELRRVV